MTCREAGSVRRGWLKGCATNSVVVELVFSLRVRAFLPLLLVTLLGRPHRHRSGSARLNRRQGKQALEIAALA